MKNSYERTSETTKRDFGLTNLIRFLMTAGQSDRISLGGV